MYKIQSKFLNKKNISSILAITLFSFTFCQQVSALEVSTQNEKESSEVSTDKANENNNSDPSQNIEIKKTENKIKTDEIKLIKELMLKLGLENIEASKSDISISEKNEYIISYENRTFLHEINLIGALLAGLKDIINDNSHLNLYPQSNGKVITKIGLEYQDYLGFKNKTISEEDFSKKLDIVMSPSYEFSKDKTNPLMFHSDLVISPAYILDPTNGPLILLAPYINSYLDKGFTFNTRYRLPVYNVINSFDFTKNSAIFAPSFGYTNIDYSSPILNLPLYSTGRIGYIYENMGHNVILSNDLQYMLFGGFINLNMATGVNFNLTNKAVDFSITPYGQIYLGKIDLVLEGGAGKFLYGEYGAWGRITRQFNNVDLGFSVYKTFGQPQSGTRLNFEYNLAIGPEHSINAAPVRVTYPRFFSGSLVAGQNVGFNVARYKAEDFVKRLYPEYIRTHLYYWLDY